MEDCPKDLGKTRRLTEEPLAHELSNQLVLQELAISRLKELLESPRSAHGSRAQLATDIEQERRQLEALSQQLLDKQEHLVASSEQVAQLEVQNAAIKQENAELQEQNSVLVAEVQRVRRQLLLSLSSSLNSLNSVVN